MYAENNGVCVECQCGCHEKSRKQLVEISSNLKHFGSEAFKWLFWCFVVYCLFGGLSR